MISAGTDWIFFADGAWLGEGGGGGLWRRGVMWILCFLAVGETQPVLVVYKTLYHSLHT